MGTYLEGTGKLLQVEDSGQGRGTLVLGPIRFAHVGSTIYAFTRVRLLSDLAPNVCIRLQVFPRTSGAFAFNRGHPECVWNPLSLVKQMSSYIVKSTNIAEAMKKLADIVSQSGGSISTYKQDIGPALQSKEYSRIRHFYYCDDREGITVRLFDPEFASQSSDLGFKSSRVIFRAEKLGREDGPAKKELLQTWEKYQHPPPGVNTNNIESADKYFFKQLNGGPVQTEVEPLEYAESNKELVLARYQSLWETTCIGSDFFSKLEATLVSFQQIILEGPPGSGKTWVAREFAKWWTSPEADAAVGSQWQIIQLHESYGYEDFFQGIRPVLLDENRKLIPPHDTTTPVEKLVFRDTDGIFRSLCNAAGDNEPDLF
jgi:hypothetical protein